MLTSGLFMLIDLILQQCKYIYIYIYIYTVYIVNINCHGSDLCIKKYFFTSELFCIIPAVEFLLCLPVQWKWLEIGVKHLVCECAANSFSLLHRQWWTLEGRVGEWQATESQDVSHQLRHDRGQTVRLLWWGSGSRPGLWSQTPRVWYRLVFNEKYTKA